MRADIVIVVLYILGSIFFLAGSVVSLVQKITGQ